MKFSYIITKFLLVLILCSIIPIAFAAEDEMWRGIGFAEKVEDAIATIFHKLGDGMDRISLAGLTAVIWVVIALFFVLVILIFHTTVTRVYPWYRQFMFILRDFMGRL